MDKYNEHKLYINDPLIYNAYDINDSCMDEIENYIPIDDIGIVTSTCVIEFTSRCIDPILVYKYIDIYEDDSVYLERENSKYIIIGIGPPGAILSAKIKGKENLSRGLNKNKGFSKAVTLDISLDDKNVNIFLFHDKIKITGCKREEHPIEVYNFLCEHLKRISVSLEIDVEIPEIQNIKWQMLHSQFNIGKSIDLYDFNNKIKGLGGFRSTYMNIVNSDSIDIRYPSPYVKKNGDRKYRMFKCYRDGSIIFRCFSWYEYHILYKWFWFIYDTIINYINK